MSSLESERPRSFVHCPCGPEARPGIYRLLRYVNVDAWSVTCRVGVSTLEISPSRRGRVELNGYPQPSRVHTGTPATRDVSGCRSDSPVTRPTAGPRGRMGESLTPCPLRYLPCLTGEPGATRAHDCLPGSQKGRSWLPRYKRSPTTSSARSEPSPPAGAVPGRDVAALGYTNTSKAPRIAARGSVSLPPWMPGGIQQVRFISEGDLYRLIVSSAAGRPAVRVLGVRRGTPVHPPPRPLRDRRTVGRR